MRKDRFFNFVNSHDLDAPDNTVQISAAEWQLVEISRAGQVHDTADITEWLISSQILSRNTLIPLGSLDRPLSYPLTPLGRGLSVGGCVVN